MIVHQADSRMLLHEFTLSRCIGSKHTISCHDVSKYFIGKAYVPVLAIRKLARDSHIIARRDRKDVIGGNSAYQMNIFRKCRLLYERLHISRVFYVTQYMQ